MDKFRSGEFHFTVLLILQMQVSVFLATSWAYTLPEQYFLSCGSESTTKFGNRDFVPDGSFFVGNSKIVNATTRTSSSSSLHQTARVIKDRNSFYEFKINETGTYVVRLHFFASSVDLSDAVFNVNADGFLLLSNFSVSVNSSVTDPMIKEFLFTIKAGKFCIYITPHEKRSFAFVNAMEVFLAPEDFLLDVATRIAPGGSKVNYRGLLSRALREIYRINVGGSKITADTDTMLRTWIPDEDFFLSDPQSAKNVKYESQLRISGSEFYAPDIVYQTAKDVKSDGGNQTSITTLTWGFNVKRNSTYFIRAHFYNIFSAEYSNLAFDFKVNSNFTREVRPYAETNSSVEVPFHLDFVLEHYDLETMNVSVVSRNEFKVQHAFLNGLEIMEVMEKSSKPKINTRPIMFGLIGGVILLVVLIVVFVVAMRLNSLKIEKSYSGRLMKVPLYGGSFQKRQNPTSGNNISLAPNVTLKLKMKYSDIRRATKNFSRKRLIGRGGFGEVYRGTLRDGTKVAVKRREPGCSQGFKEFENEIKLLSKIHHRRLVSLVGYCDEKSEMILVYEFMEKGTLQEHLYEVNTRKSCSQSKLSWEQRLEICIDAAEGLQYLHSELDVQIIHRDVKSTNILLDENLVAKVSDFGISKTGLHGDVNPDATAMKGSIGYMDPETAIAFHVTEKADVYSFGVVLLEVLCARPVNIPSDNTKSGNLVDWGLYWQKKGQLENIADPVLKGTINSDSLRKFGEIVESCLRPSGVDRPSMEQVKYDLKLAFSFQRNSMRRQQQDDSLIDMDSSVLAFGIVHDIASGKLAVDENGQNFRQKHDVSSVSMTTHTFVDIKDDHGS